MLGLNLPEDIVNEILARLPVKSLLRFKCLAKSFYALVSDHSFIDKHLQLSISTTKNRPLQFVFRLHRLTLKPCISLLSNEPPHVLDDIELPFPEKKDVEYIFVYGQCNGIFCLHGVYGGNNNDDANHRTCSCVGSTVLWNPATRKVKVLPSCHRQHRDMVYVIFGFGVDIKTNDYKVVRFGNLAFEGREQPPVEVYNLSTDSWRTINVTVPAFRLRYPKCRAYLNGYYHWLVDDQNDKAILCFDFTKELFGKMNLPSLSVMDSPAEANVAVIKEQLAFVATYFNRGNFRFEIWVMDEHGVEESWNRKFNIGPCPEFASFLGFWGDDEVLVEDDGELVTYNMENQQVQRFQIHGIPRLFRVFGYVESLVPLAT